MAGEYVYIVNLPLKSTNIYENLDFQESLWCLVLNGDDFILVEIFYRLPTNSLDNDAWMMDLITKTTCSCMSHLLIIADFNFPDICRLGGMVIIW